MKKKGILTGKFFSKPEVGRFSYAKTRRMITTKILDYTRAEKDEENPDSIFVGVTEFDVDEDGFTLEVKVSKFKFNTEADGKEEELVKLEILDELEEVFNIGKNKFNKEEAKKLSEDGILLIGYFKNFKDDEED